MSKDPSPKLDALRLMREQQYEKAPSPKAPKIKAKPKTKKK